MHPVPVREEHASEPRSRRRDILLWASMALALLAFFSLVHASSPLLFGVDAYFHIKYGRILWTDGLIRDFSWLAHTLYSRHFADDHFLFHCLLIPFTPGDLVTGAKAYGTLVATLVFLVFYGLLKRGNIRYPLLWTALLLVSSHTFLMRISMARAPGVSLLFLLLATGLILHRRDRWIAPLGFLYVWLYGGFPLLVAPVGAAFLVSLAVEGKPRYRLLIACAIGLSAGLVLNLYFPDNIRFLYTSYTQIELGNFPGSVQVGSEDYPYAASTAVRKALPVWALVFTVILVYLTRPRALTPDALLLFLISTAMLCLYLKVRRYIEYWPPFALLFAAYAFQPYLRDFSVKHLRRPYRFAVIGAAAVLLAAGAYRAHRSLRADLAQSCDYRHYRGAATYLKEHTPAGALVFNAEWGDFPILFHLNTHNRYIVGLGPPYLYLFDPELYDRWLEIGRGEAPQPGRSILEHFGAHYVFSLRDDEEFLESLDADPDAQIVFEDDHARVYRIMEIGQER